MTPLVELRGNVSRRLRRQRGIGRTKTFAVLPMARAARSQSAGGVSRVVKVSRSRVPARRADLGLGHRRVVGCDRSSLGWREILRDVGHLGVNPAAIGISNELTLEIAGIQPGKARRESTVSFAAEPMTGEASVGGTGGRAAECHEFACSSKPVGRHGFDWRAACQSCRAHGHPQELDARHLSSGTATVRRRFRLEAFKAHRVGERLPTAFRILFPLAVLASGCKPAPEAATEMPLASAARGKEVIERVGCGSCHTIEGISWPQGKTAPALQGFDRRGLIAGKLPNRPEVLAEFVRNAPALVADTTMPPMPLSANEALDVTAYLYEIGR